MLIFDDKFQTELEGMYRQTGAGKPAIPPALLAMAVLLQGYTKASDDDTSRSAMTDGAWPSRRNRTCIFQGSLL